MKEVFFLLIERIVNQNFWTFSETGFSTFVLPTVAAASRGLHWQSLRLFFSHKEELLRTFTGGETAYRDDRYWHWPMGKDDYGCAFSGTKRNVAHRDDVPVFASDD